MTDAAPRDSAFPLENNPQNRARGFMTRAELSRLTASRMERREILDWPRWRYCMAATLLAVERGYQKLDHRHAGVTLKLVTDWHIGPSARHPQSSPPAGMEFFRTSRTRPMWRWVDGPINRKEVPFPAEW